MAVMESDPRDEAARCRDAEALAGRQDDEAFNLLLDAARDESWRVRERAVRLLTAFPARRLVACVRDTVTGTREPSLRNVAMDALVRQGEGSVAEVVTLLAEENWEMRLHGAVMLGNIRSPLAIDALCRLLGDEEENVIHAAAESLGEIGDPRAVIPLTEVLSSHEFWSQYPAIVALGKIAHHSSTEHLLAYLNDEMLAPAVVDALGRVADPRALTPLLQLLPADDAPPFVPYPQLIRALVRITAVAGESWTLADALRAPMRRAVREALRGEEAEDRIAALLVAGWTADAELIPDMLPSLEHDGEQDAAARALSGMGEAIVPALEPLLSAPLASVRRLAVQLLSAAGHVEPILRLIIDPDEAVRMEIALAVGNSGRAELSEYVLEMLLDESDEVRSVALEVIARFQSDDRVREQLYHRLEYFPDDHLPTIVETLGRLAVADALPRLEPLLGVERDPAVRAAAVRAVSAIGAAGDKAAAARDALLPLAGDADPDVRYEVLRALDRFQGEAVFAALSRGIDDPELHCAYAAVSALGHVGDERAAPLLERAALRADADMGLRVAAVGALGRIQAESSTSALLDLLAVDDADVRREVTRALSRIPGPRALDGLRRAAADPFWGVRALAIRALASRGEAGRELVLAALSDEDSLVRKAGVRGLQEAGLAAVDRLIPLLSDDDLEETVADTLATFGPALLERIGEAGAQADPVVRIRLARLLGRIGGEKARRQLDGLSRDAVAEVAAVAQRELAGEG